VLLNHKLKITGGISKNWP